MHFHHFCEFFFKSRLHQVFGRSCQSAGGGNGSIVLLYLGDFEAFLLLDFFVGVVEAFVGGGGLASGIVFDHVQGASVQSRLIALFSTT